MTDLEQDPPATNGVEAPVTAENDRVDEEQQDEETGFRHAVMRLLRCPECDQVVTEPKTLNCGHFYCAACIPLLNDDNGEVQCSKCEDTTPVPEAGTKTHLLAAHLLALIDEYTPRQKDKDDSDIDNLPAPPNNFDGSQVNGHPEHDSDSDSIAEGGDDLKDVSADLDVDTLPPPQLEGEKEEDELTPAAAEPSQAPNDPEPEVIPPPLPPPPVEVEEAQKESSGEDTEDELPTPVKRHVALEENHPEVFAAAPPPAADTAPPPAADTAEVKTPPPTDVSHVVPPPIEVYPPTVSKEEDEKPEEPKQPDEQEKKLVEPEAEAVIVTESTPIVNGTDKVKPATSNVKVEVEVHSDADTPPSSPKKAQEAVEPIVVTPVMILETEPPKDQESNGKLPSPKPVEVENGEKPESFDEPDRVMKPSEMKPAEAKKLIEEQRECNSCHSKDCNCNVNSILTPPVSMGSSQSVDQTLSCPPSEYDDTEILIQPVSRWAVDDSASNIEVYNKNRIHVTRWTYDDHGAITTFDASGKKQKMIQHSKMSHHNYSGVAISRLGFLFALNTTKQKLEEYSCENGKKIRSAKLEQCHDPQALDITSSGEVIVVDQERNAVLLYPNSKCVRPKTYKHELLKEPNDVVAVDDGFYVTCGQTRCVLKFNYSGDVVWTFNVEREGKSRLRNPKGICVDEKGSLYVVDAGNRSVLVFDKSGEVKGRLCDKETDSTRKPWYISVKDGTIAILYEHNIVRTYRFA